MYFVIFQRNPPKFLTTNPPPPHGISECPTIRMQISSILCTSGNLDRRVTSFRGGNPCLTGDRYTCCCTAWRRSLQTRCKTRPTAPELDSPPCSVNKHNLQSRLTRHSAVSGIIRRARRTFTETATCLVEQKTRRF